MSSARNEPPTPRRLQEARRRGDVAASPELTAAAVLGGGLAAVATLGPAIGAELARLLRGGLLLAAEQAPAPERVLHAALLSVVRLVAPVAICAAAAGGLAGALQAGFGWFPGALRPRLERVDPLKGLRRLLSPAQLLRAPLGLAKAAALVWILAAWVRDTASALGQLPRAAPAGLLRAAPGLLGLGVRLLLALAAFALLDYALARRRHRRALAMTRDEVRREQKEEEGDPAHRGERRRRHRAILDAGPVSGATVLVVNPSHLAVALRHERGGEEPPRVVAKGSGRGAARLRSAARRAGVPIVRDVPLARALHRLAEVGDELPEELYEAAAALLAHLYAAPEVP